VLSPKSVSIGVAGITPGLARDVPLALRGGVLVERLNFTKVTYTGDRGPNTHWVHGENIESTVNM